MQPPVKRQEQGEESKCGWCQTVLAQPLQCGRCKAKCYCDKQCQKKDWALHRTRCGGATVLSYCTLQEVNGCLDMLLAAYAAPLDEKMRHGIMETLGLEKPLNVSWCDFLEVRASPVHGLGVFATRALPKGAVLTSYPMHLMAIAGVLYRVMGEDVPLDETRENMDYWGAHYSFQMDEHIKAIGLPNQHSERRLLGHMINDGCLVNPFANTPVGALADPKKLLQRILPYYENVLTYTNCTFRKCRQGLLVCVVAQREIAAGEELLVNYGLDYWQAVNYGGDVDRRFPYILRNMMRLRKTSKRFLALSDRSLALDRLALGEDKLVSFRQ
jgi:hypothetical protein